MIHPTPEDIAWVAMNTKPIYFLQMDTARLRVGKRRFEEGKLKGKLNIGQDTQGLWPDALQLNLQGLQNFDVVQRVKRLTYPLVALDRVHGHEHELKVLCVGPRTEMELMTLWGLGFRHVRGLDLFSYSPYVDTGNIMNAPYPDNTFDIVICGWVLVYTDDPLKACKEISRIAKPNGIISIGSTYYPPNTRTQERSNGRTDAHYPLADELLARFHVKHTYVKHDPERLDRDGRTIVIFEQSK